MWWSPRYRDTEGSCKALCVCLCVGIVGGFLLLSLCELPRFFTPHLSCSFVHSGWGVGLALAAIGAVFLCLLVPLRCRVLWSIACGGSWSDCFVEPARRAVVCGSCRRVLLFAACVVLLAQNVTSVS